MSEGSVLFLLREGFLQEMLSIPYDQPPPGPSLRACRGTPTIWLPSVASSVALQFTDSFLAIFLRLSGFGIALLW